MNHFDKALSSYQHIGSQAYQTAASLTPDDAHDYLRWFLLDMPVIPFLLVFHCLFAAVKTHALVPPNAFWLKSLVVTMAVAFGGSTTAAVLSGRPPPLFTVSSNFMISYLLLAWYAVHHMRPVRALLSTRPVLAALAFGATAAKARSIFAFIDDFAREYPGAAAGAVALGGLAGSGGQLFASLERIVQHGLDAPSELSAPGWGFKSAFVAAAAYYIAVDPDDVLRGLSVPFAASVDRSVARLYISAALCTHAALETLYGQHINPLYAFERVFYAVTGLHPPFDPEETARAARERVMADAREGRVLGSAAAPKSPAAKASARSSASAAGMRRRGTTN